MESEEKIQKKEEQKATKKQSKVLNLIGEVAILALSTLLGIGAIFVGFWLINNANTNPHIDFSQYIFGVLLIFVGIAFIMFSIVNFLTVSTKISDKESSH